MFIADPATLFPSGIVAAVDRRSMSSGWKHPRQETRRVLLMDNTLGCYGTLEVALREADCIVSKAGCVAEVLELVARQQFNVILIDLRPDLLGYEAICALRASRIFLPLLFVSARSCPDAIDRAIALGANDVVTLPIDTETLAARIDTVSQHRCTAARSTITIGAIQLDITHGRVSVGRHPVNVSDVEFAILEAVSVRNGAAVSTDSLVRTLTDKGYSVDYRGVENAISRIRRRLMPYEADRLFIKVRGLGYALRERPTEQHS